MVYVTTYTYLTNAVPTHHTVLGVWQSYEQAVSLVSNYIEEIGETIVFTIERKDMGLYHVKTNNGIFEVTAHYLM